MTTVATTPTAPAGTTSPAGPSTPSSPGRSLLTMTGLEARLLTREWAPMLFAFIFPPMMMLVLAGVFASDEGPEFLGLSGTDYYIAAYLAVPMAAVALIGLPVALAGYRERGVLRRLVASGLSTGTVIGAQVIVTALLLVLGAGLVLAVAAPVYGLPEMQNLAGVVGSFVLGAALLLVLGVVLGLLVSTARSAQALGLLLFMPMWLLGGGGPPPGVMTGPMQTVSDFLPLTPVTEGVRESWLRGGDIGEPLLQMTAWLVGGLVLVAVLLRRRSEA